MSEVEVWKTIPGIDGYEASSLGRVRSWRTGNGKPGRRAEPRIMTPSVGHRGYQQVTVNGSRTMPVHRLVLEAFVGPRPDGMLCRHLDGDRRNNHVDNITWGTPAENNEDQRRHGTLAMGDRSGARTCPEKWKRGEVHHFAKLSDGDVIVIRMLSSLPKHERPSQSAIGQAFGVRQCSVSRYVLGAARRSAPPLALPLAR